ncbi:hypothetical protein [Streptomyces violascens]|uniref:hypothetical protein n=1 Tax=Streptomyces violascens TaxID=67381 RepID=UPI00369CF884
MLRPPLTGPPITRRRRLTALSPLLLACVAGLLLPTADAAASVTLDDTTIGTPGHITLTYPSTIQAGDLVELSGSYTNTTTRILDSVSLSIRATSAAGQIDYTHVTQLPPFDPFAITALSDGIVATANYIAPGASGNFSITLLTSTSATGPLTFTESLSENLADQSNITLLPDIVMKVAPPSADLGVTLTSLGDNDTITATVTNYGPRDASSARLRLTYPAGVEVSRADNCSINATFRTVICYLGYLPRGVSSTRPLRLIVPPLNLTAGDFTVNATLTNSTPKDPTPDNNASQLTCHALTFVFPIRC